MNIMKTRKITAINQVTVFFMALEEDISTLTVLASMSEDLQMKNFINNFIDIKVDLLKLLPGPIKARVQVVSAPSKSRIMTYSKMPDDIISSQIKLLKAFYHVEENQKETVKALYQNPGIPDAFSSNLETIFLKYQRITTQLKEMISMATLREIV